MNGSVGRAVLAGVALALLVGANPPPRPAESYAHAKAITEALANPWDELGFHSPSMEFTNFFNHAREQPASSLRITNLNPDAYRHPPPTLLLGDLLYHAPGLLGRQMVAFGLSCNSCHPNGGTSRDLFSDGESDRVGNVDMMFTVRSPLPDDGIYAPRNIPSLRGIRYRWPYLYEGTKSTLREDLVTVVSVAFQQPIRPDWLNALTLYTEQFDFVPNAQLDELGRLTGRASAAAHRGEVLFRTERAALGGQSCSSCHRPDSYFTDHQTHRFFHGVGDHTTPGEAVKTASLLNIVESPPYFFDGSATTLAQAVRQLDRKHQLNLTPGERADLTEYLAAVGAVDRQPAIPTLAERFASTLVYLDLVLDSPMRDDQELWPICLDTVRHELRLAVREARPGPQRTRADAAVRDFEGYLAERGALAPSEANRARLAALRKRLEEAAGLAPLGGRSASASQVTAK